MNDLTSANFRASGNPPNGQKFTQMLVDQTPVFDGRRKHNQPVKKHRGNKYRAPNFLK